MRPLALCSKKIKTPLARTLKRAGSHPTLCGYSPTCTYIRTHSFRQNDGPTRHHITRTFTYRIAPSLSLARSRFNSPVMVSLAFPFPVQLARALACSRDVAPKAIKVTQYSLSLLLAPGSSLSSRFPHPPLPRSRLYVPCAHAPRHLPALAPSLAALSSRGRRRPQSLLMLRCCRSCTMDTHLPPGTSYEAD